MRKTSCHFAIYPSDRRHDRPSVPVKACNAAVRGRCPEAALNSICGRSRGQRQAALFQKAVSITAHWLQFGTVARRTGCGPVCRAHCATGSLSSAASISANVLVGAEPKSPARVDLPLAIGQPVTLFEPRTRRQLLTDGVFVIACSVFVHHVDMHCLDHLSAVTARIHGHANSAPLTFSQLFLSLVTARFEAEFCLIFRKFACCVLAAERLQFELEFVIERTPRATVFANFEIAPAPCFGVRRPSFMPVSVLNAFQTRRMFSVVAESMRWNENTRSEKSVRSGGEFGDSRRQDKRGSPSERQAIDMAWVRPCRSVGARAALQTFASKFKVFSALCRLLSARGLQHERGRTRISDPSRAHPPYTWTEREELHQSCAESGKDFGSCRLARERQWTPCGPRSFHLRPWPDQLWP
jgi:hypothetical protein